MDGTGDEEEGGEKGEDGGSYSKFNDSDQDDDVFAEDEVKVQTYHTIIIDCAPIGFADSMGVAMIEQVCLSHNHHVIII